MPATAALKAQANERFGCWAATISCRVSQKSFTTQSILFTSLKYPVIFDSCAELPC
jgi:hypothetical protein